MGKIPVPKMKNGRNPIYGKNTHGVLGLLGGVFGGDLQFPNEKWQGPFYAEKGRREKEKGKKKKEKGGEIRKNWRRRKS